MAAKRVVHIECEVNDDAPYHLYTMLEKGKKKFEVRPLLVDKDGIRNKWWHLLPGTFDEATLKVVNASDKKRSFTRVVESVTCRRGYKCLLESVGFQACVPGAKDVEEALEKVYKRFYPDHMEDCDVIAVGLHDH